jgi:hypothetical protein
MSKRMRTRTLLSPPEVARRPLPVGSKCAEYMGAVWSCQLMIKGVLFIVARGSSRTGAGAEGRDHAQAARLHRRRPRAVRGGGYARLSGWAVGGWKVRLGGSSGDVGGCEYCTACVVELPFGWEMGEAGSGANPMAGFWVGCRLSELS